MHTEPDTDWKNIFQLWREGGEALPFQVAKSSWAADAGHFLVVERVEIKKWPYGAAGVSIIGEESQARKERRSISPERTCGKSSNSQMYLQEDTRNR
ncbi:hypothetical protein [Phyllobacterium endophyticum]|uniref:hypothetical protein n=1 Tax=Phyllobacterium endophyticum TaxID=1149773 RepID=UPI001AEEF44B|nr:hypothetical protein [Phyllobacterium endophyticum]